MKCYSQQNLYRSLSFDLYPGNQNKPLTLKPLETKVIRDFNCSEFIFCSDAEPGSKDNRFLTALETGLM